MGKYLDSIGLANLIGKIKTALGLKQDTLVSGTNIKTVNNQSLLGSGNIAISGGSSLNEMLAMAAEDYGDWGFLWYDWENDNVEFAAQIPVLHGGTGATNAAQARTNLGLGTAATHAHGDYALAGHTHSYLPLSGGNLTGNLGVKSVLTLGSNTTGEENGIKLKGGGTRNGWVLRTISAANGDGDAVLLGDGGLTIIGAGEAAPNLWDALGVSAGTETLYLASDNGVEIHTNCQTIANRQTVAITTNGSIIGPNNHAIKLAGVDSSASNNGITTAMYRYHSFLDESDRYIGWLGTTVATDGDITTTVAARRRNGNANFDNVLSLGVTKEGTRTVSVSDQASWRSALGLGTAATRADSYFLKRQPASTSDLPSSSATSGFFPIVLDNSFANNGKISYMTTANFEEAINAFANGEYHWIVGTTPTSPGLSISKYTSAAVAGWTYKKYLATGGSGYIYHAHAVVKMKNIAVSTAHGSGYINSQNLFIRLPHAATVIKCVTFGSAMGGGPLGLTFLSAGGTGDWKSASNNIYNIPVRLFCPTSLTAKNTDNDNNFIPVDVWFASLT